MQRKFLPGTCRSAWPAMGGVGNRRILCDGRDRLATIRNLFLSEETIRFIPRSFFPAVHAVLTGHEILRNRRLACLRVRRALVKAEDWLSPGKYNGAAACSLVCLPRRCALLGLRAHREIRELLE